MLETRYVHPPRTRTGTISGGHRETYPLNTQKVVYSGKLSA